MNREDKVRITQVANALNDLQRSLVSKISNNPKLFILLKDDVDSLGKGVKALADLVTNRN